MRYLLLLLCYGLYLDFNFKPQIHAYHINGFAQGTTYRITYYAADSIVSQEDVEHILMRIDSSLSIYKPYSLISRFNNSGSGVVADTFLKAVVIKSLEVSKATSGAFDITVLPLVGAWGFGVNKVSVLPDSATIKSILPCVGSGHIRLSGNRLTKQKPCVQIDVNGIAQGYTVDVISDYLDRKSVSNYLVEIGGELRVKGANPLTDKPMRIGIEAPSQSEFDDEPFQKVIYISKGAVTTSGSYRKFYQSASKTVNHLIDPRTGYPANTNLISVTVYAKDAITADAYDNALMLMGLTKAKAFVEANKGLEAFFIYSKPNGIIADTATAGFYKLLK